MIRSLSFVGVVSAAIIESRPHDHLQMANVQLLNATEAVIKTAAIAGLAYAGAYMAAAGSTPGAYDSSRRSQASSTGQQFCDTRELDPTKYHCTSSHFNGLKTASVGEGQGKVAIRNYWCCPASDVGGEYPGGLNGVCVSQNLGLSNFASPNPGFGNCVYQGPCASGGFPVDPPTNPTIPRGVTGTVVSPQSSSSDITVTGTVVYPFNFNFALPGIVDWLHYVCKPVNDRMGSCDSPLFQTLFRGPIEVVADAQTGRCSATGNVGLPQNWLDGVDGGSPSGYYALPVVPDLLNPSSGAAGGLGPMHGVASVNGVRANNCCVKDDNAFDVFDLDPSALNQPVSFCQVQSTCPDGYTIRTRVSAPDTPTSPFQDLSLVRNFYSKYGSPTSPSQEKLSLLLTFSFVDFQTDLAAIQNDFLQRGPCGTRKGEDCHLKQLFRLS